MKPARMSLDRSNVLGEAGETPLKAGTSTAATTRTKTATMTYRIIGTDFAADVLMGLFAVC